MASAESAGDAEGSGTDLVAVMTDFVAVMDPSHASSEEGTAPIAQADAATNDRSDDDAGPTATGSGGATDGDTSTTPAADMAATAGDPASDEEAAVPEAVGASAGPADNPATRFIRSLTGWGSHEHPNGGHAK
jgi:hypothetical protein